MEIKIKRIISVVLALVVFFNFHNWRGIEMRSIDVHAATFDDINQSSVFLKQAENDTCTLAAATMMLRRTAILRGDTNWKDITERKLRSTAWLEGAGLLNSFTYSNIKVKNAALDMTESRLISLLKDHPEGIVIHNPSTPHAVLLTDYTDGIFYCADPANGIAKGRIKLTNSYTVRVNNATQYWYVSSPKVSIDSKVNTVRINYHTNGGTIGNDEYYAKDGKIYNSEDKVVGEKWEYGTGDSTGLFNASTFKLTKKGYTFTGWSTSKSGGTVFDPDDTSLTANDIYPDIATKSGTVVLYAQWKKNTVTINYNTNGGTISSDKYYSEDNGDIYVTSTKKIKSPKWEYGSGSEDGLYNASTFGLSRKGYTFLGWSTVKSGGKIYDQKDASLTANDIFPDIITKSGTMMMYAQWGGKEMKETEGAGQKIPDGDYWIVNALNSRYAVDISGDNYDTTKGTNLKMHLWSSDNFGKYDVFTVKYLNNGFYSITQKNTNVCIDVYDASLSAGTNVQMWTSNDSVAQQWSIKETNNGYTIQSRCNGFYLDVEGGSTENANLQVYPGNNSKSQLFSFIPYDSGQPVKDGVYRIGTVNGKGAYIDAAGEPDEYKNKTNLQIWDAGADNYFRFEYSGNGFYKIYDNESGLAVDVDNSSQRNYLTREANVQLYESKDTPGQYWAIKSDGEGYYYLISKLNGYYLDLNKGITTNGNNIHMWSATNGKTQKWSLVTNKKLVVTPPSKTTYNVGENVDLSGMTAKMVFSDGYEWDVTKYVNVSCDLNSSGVKNATVTYKNGGFTNKATFEINVKDNKKIIGDVNIDGVFNVADVVTLQKWLLGASDITLDDWKAADLCKDDRLDVFDLCLMKQELVNVS